MTPWYIIGGLGGYLLVGLGVLAWRSRRTPELWPSADVEGFVHLLSWPFVLFGWRFLRWPTPTPTPSMTPTSTVAVGTTGRVVSELRPFGRIEIAGTTHDARAEHGSIRVGTTVHVVRVERVVVVRETV